MTHIARPQSVTIVAYFVIAVSSLTGVLHMTALPAAAALWGVVESATKIALAAGLLKRIAWTRMGFVAFWFLAGLVVDLVVHRTELAEADFLMNRVIVLLFGIIYLGALIKRNVRRWFGEEVHEPAAEELRRRAGMKRAASGALLVAVSSGLLLFFAWHVYLDLATFTTWKKAEATIVAAEVKGNVVREVRSHSGPLRGSEGATEIVTYDPEIRYRYSVEGIEYESTNFSTLRSTLSAISHPEQLEIRYVPGALEECWYDPGNPSRAVLQRGISPYYAFAFFVLILFAIGKDLYRDGRSEFHSSPPVAR